jgi:hypothetical protein
MYILQLERLYGVDPINPIKEAVFRADKLQDIFEVLQHEREDRIVKVNTLDLTDKEKSLLTQFDGNGFEIPFGDTVEIPAYFKESSELANYKLPDPSQDYFAGGAILIISLEERIADAQKRAETEVFAKWNELIENTIDAREYLAQLKP